MRCTFKPLHTVLRLINKRHLHFVLSLMFLLMQANSAPAIQNEDCPDYPLEGINGVNVQEFLQDNKVCALLVSHNGKTVINEYYIEDSKEKDPKKQICAHPPNRCPGEQGENETEYGLASMTKSINSTLLGLLIHQTGTPNIDDTIESIFPDSDFKKGGYGCRTVKDVLLMNGGIDWNKKKSDEVGARMRATVHNNSGTLTFHDFLQKVTEDEPCSKRCRNQYSYKAIDSIMLGLVTQKHLNDKTELKSLPDAYIEWLWGPLGMTGSVKWNGEHKWKGRKCKSDKEWRWKTPNGGVPPEGMVATDCCMYAHPCDMLKFGNFILKNYQATSNSDEYPIRDWLHASAENAVSTSPLPNCLFPPVYKDYGYQWWHLGDKDRDYDEMGFSAIGRGGQFIRIIPKYNTVIVQFSSSDHNTVDDIQCKSFRFHKKILNAITRDH